MGQKQSVPAGQYIDGTLHFADGGKIKYDTSKEVTVIKGNVSGFGVKTYANGDTLECYFSNGKAHGKGIKYYTSGSRLECEWVEGLAKGKGTAYFANGDRVECEFANGRANGESIKYGADGSIFRCNMKNSKYDGIGILSNANGIYSSLWNSNVQIGEHRAVQIGAPPPGAVQSLPSSVAMQSSPNSGVTPSLPNSGTPGSALPNIIDEETQVPEMSCVVCFTNKIKVVLMPCSHSNCCIACADKCKECPVCRTKITYKIKHY